MRQFLYVSESLIGDDLAALDRLMVQARTNNALDGITGLLWTDGRRFAQVVEGGDAAISALISTLSADPRHRNLEIVHDAMVAERQFGGWAMTRPATDSLAATYEQRMLHQLSRVTNSLATTFQHVIGESRRAVLR